MACMSILAEGQSLASRIAETEKSLKRLETYLQTGTVRISISPQGAISFQGWRDSDRISDTCAFRSLSATNSWALRQAVMKAEAMSGRRVNLKAVAAGIHTHDSGRTWEKH